MRIDIARYLTADIGSRMGNQLDFLTLTWLTYELEKSSLNLGILGFCYSIPFLFLSAPAGTISDRNSRKTVLLTGYVAHFLIAAVLVTINLAGVMTMPVIFAGALTIGSVSALTTPALSGILKDFIKNEDLFGRLSGVAAADGKFGQVIASAVFGFLYGIVAAAGTLILYGALALVSLISISGIKTASDERPKPAPGQSLRSTRAARRLTRRRACPSRYGHRFRGLARHH